MKNVYSLTLRSLMRGVKAYVFLAVMFLAEGFFLTYVNLSGGYSATEYSFELIEIALMAVLPLICAETFSADRKSGFEKTLLAFGIKPTELYFGKALAVVTVLTVPYLLLLAVPLVLEAFGTVNLSATLTSVGAFYLTGLSFTAICLFVSLCVKSRRLAYIVSYAALLVSYVCCLFSGAVTVTKDHSLLMLSAVLVAVSILIYLFTRSMLVFGGFFCISEAILIFFYFVTPRLFAKAFAELVGLLSPALSLNSIIYGTFDLVAVMHLILFTAVLVLLSLMQLGRRKYE